MKTPIYFNTHNDIIISFERSTTPWAQPGTLPSAVRFREVESGWLFSQRNGGPAPNWEL